MTPSTTLHDVGVDHDVTTRERLELRRHIRYLIVHVEVNNFGWKPNTNNIAPAVNVTLRRPVSSSSTAAIGDDVAESRRGAVNDDVGDAPSLASLTLRDNGDVGVVGPAARCFARPERSVIGRSFLRARTHTH